MAKPGISNAGAGKALLHTRLRFELHAVIFCLVFGAIVFIIPNAIRLLTLNSSEQSILLLDLEERLTMDSVFKRWTIEDDGQKYFIVAKTGDGERADILSPPQMKKAAAELFQQIDSVYEVLSFSKYLGIIAAIGLYIWMYRHGRRSQESERIGGADKVIPLEELNRRVIKAGASPYSFAGARLPNDAPMRGLLALGSQGSGKSVAIHRLMKSVLRRSGRKCIIYDQSGEFYRAHFRPGKDYFFNPALEGSVPWSIFSELNYTYDADTLAQAFLPVKSGSVAGPNAFFEDAARALFSVILLRLARLGVMHTADIAKAFLEMPEEEMTQLIAKSVASSAVGGDSKQQRQGVISSIAIYLNGIAAVQPGAWSITDFLKEDSDARLFIVRTDDTKAMFAPLYRLMLSVAFAAIASEQEQIHEDKYWFFLDEVQTLGDIKLDEQLTTQRKYGVCIVSGVQSESQVIDQLGRDRAATVLNAFNTILQLKTGEPELQERAAARLGKMEISQVNQNQQLGVSEWRDGSGLNFSERDKFVVHPGSLSGLSACQGYIRVAGDFPVAKVDYSDWLKPYWFIFPSVVSNFAENQPNPKRDPSFIIRLPEELVATRRAPVTLAGVRETLQQEVAQQKAVEMDEKANEAEVVPAAKAETDKPGPVEAQLNQADTDSDKKSAIDGLAL